MYTFVGKVSPFLIIGALTLLNLGERASVAWTVPAMSLTRFRVLSLIHYCKFALSCATLLW